MPGLTEVRTLILVGDAADAEAEADFDLLSRRTTTHLLPLTTKRAPWTLLRVLKRLLMKQDDLLVLYRLPPSWGVLIALAARLRGRPVLSVLGKAPRPLDWPALRLSKLALAAPEARHVGEVQGKRRRVWPLDGAPQRREETVLRALARVASVPWPAASRAPLRLDIGCGSQVRAGFVGIDARRTAATAIVGDARALPVGTGLADEVYASCLLEHFDDPHEVLREIHRVLRTGGQAVLRLPNLGTYSSHLDTTHRFLADLALWRRILAGYFEEVQVVPVGTKYRDNPWLVRVNWLLVNGLRWYELAQGWDFICRRPKAEPSVEYTGWWEE